MKPLGGRDAERLMEAWLRAEGWEVDRRCGAPALYRGRDGRVFSKSQDVFRCVDLIAMRPDQVWFIQVTTKNCVSARKAKIERVRWPVYLIRNGYVRVSIAVHEVVDKIMQWHFRDFDGLNWRGSAMRIDTDKLKAAARAKRGKR